MSVRFAVIGCGRVSYNHFDAIEHAPHAELVAVCDIIEEKAKKAALKHGLSKWYTDAEEMLDNEEIDVCCILVPSGMHAECACLVASHGVHVLCEKPLDVTREKMDKMINCCKENNVKLGAIFQRRTFDGAIKIKKLLEDGVIGKITLAEASLKYYRDQEYYDSGEWRATWELDGGGALMNQGVHGIDMLSWIMGGIHSVYARCETLVWDVEVEDTAVVSVKFKNGAIGVIQGTTTAYPGLDTIFSFHGPDGSISFGDNCVYKWRLKDETIEEPEILGSMGGENCQYSTTNYGHTVQIEDMAMAVIEDRDPMITGEEARKSVGLILAIYESARTGKEIIIE
ncbi:MAG: Gfo/Idh/MocA family oxidoreductase [Ruminococcaceae bacterium]|nr:Gfo/Idh/MocA family oxidoreductase [Oscillospiraceae bacterium]